MSVYTKEQLKKIIFSTATKGKGKGSKQEVPDDVMVVQKESPEEEEEKTDGEDGEDEGQDGTDGTPGEPEKGEGKGEGEGKGSSKADQKAKDYDQIMKKAQEFEDTLRGTDPESHNCGSDRIRSDKKDEEKEKNPDEYNEEVNYITERIRTIMEEAEESSGKESPILPRKGKAGKGGKGSIGATDNLVPIPMRRPEFLDMMKDFAEKEYEKERTKKDTDWLYTQSYDNITFKDRPKVSIPKKAVYILVDVSGSMFGDFDGTGTSLLEHLIGYLPTIAEDFEGEVWWMSSGILEWKEGSKCTLEIGESEITHTVVNADGSTETISVPEMKPGTPAINNLAFFRDKDSVELSNFFNCVTSAKGSGQGTVFDAELQNIQTFRREAEGNNAPIICLTDGIVDPIYVKYIYPMDSENMVEGRLPPNTIFMTDLPGILYMQENGYSEDPSEGYFDYEKNIQYFDITENGKYKVDTGR